MNQKRKKKQFIEFLKDEGILTEFIAELSYSKPSLIFHKKSKMTFTQYLNAIKPINWVIASFDWASSKRGVNYWAIINMYWRDIITT